MLGDVLGVAGFACSRFPLLEQLEFCDARNGAGFGSLPAIVGLLAAITEPELPGDACALLPSTEGIAPFVALISGLTAAAQNVPALLEKYIRQGFRVGETVRVLPSGHVYRFCGFFEEKYGKPLKLGLIDPVGGVISFPLAQAVRLEKTLKTYPKGRGDTKWGTLQRSPLDLLIGTETAGNSALLANQVMLISSQTSFVEFMENVRVRCKGSTGEGWLLSEIVPWGTVDQEGDIEFRQRGAATGEPLIAVSSRPEWVALACRKWANWSPLVIADGASRIRDLQAFDDLVEFGKLTVLASHREMPLVQELSKRKCTVWNVPYSSETLANSADLLHGFGRTCRQAAEFKIDTRRCQSDEIDSISRILLELNRRIESAAAPDSCIKLLGRAYSRLMDLSSLVHDPDADELDFLRGIFAADNERVRSQQLWLPAETTKLFEEVFARMHSAFLSWESGVRLGKQLALLESVDEAISSTEPFCVTANGDFALNSAVRLLRQECATEVSVEPISSIAGNDFRTVILTAWPRAAVMDRLLNSYGMHCLKALAYGFETDWFLGAWQRRQVQLRQGDRDSEEIRALVGYSGTLIPVRTSQPDERLMESVGSLDQLITMEERFGSVRKGSTPATLPESELRNAKYVGFRGDTYAYLTATREVPRINAFLSGKGNLSKSVPMVRVDGLAVGDRLLFRYAADSDQDVIRVIAERLCGDIKYAQLRERAGRWKAWLTSTGETAEEIRRRLAVVGITRSTQAVRNWMGDPDRIGPDTQKTLKAVADISGQNMSAKELDNVWSSIQSVRGAHLTAGFRLSQLLYSQLPQQLPELRDTETFVNLEMDGKPLGKVVVVQVDFVGPSYEPRPYWEVNRLLLDDEG